MDEQTATIELKRSPQRAMRKVNYMELKLSKEEKQLLNLLPKGSERPRPGRELASLTGLSARKVYEIISRLIVVYKKPIGAVRQHPGNGYFIITNDRERQQALGPLKSQIAMMNKRAQIIGNADLSKE